jgi:uncharacterized Fe-S cluster protein YjdI/CDGSH-type Zn-finger protein
MVSGGEKVSGRLHAYEGADVTVTFDAGRCIHNAHCVRHLPQVFNTAARPWVQPDQADAADVLRIVAGCPTGALRAVRRDGGDAEALVPQSQLDVRVARDGPLFIRGALELLDADGAPMSTETRVALCRCGQSKRKPFCDNSHRTAGWRDTATPG